MKLGYLITYLRINPKWIKELNVRLKNIKILKLTQSVKSLTFLVGISFLMYLLG